MSIDNPFNGPPQETPKPDIKIPEQPENDRTTGEHELSVEQREQYEQWIKDHPDEITAPENLKDCEPEITEFEAMLETFELTHSIEELHLIIDLRPEDAPKYPLRESAKAALIPIVKKMNDIKAKTNILPERHDELKAKYMRLSRAVGMINNNRVDHNRQLPSEKK